MRKILCGVLAVILCISLLGCSQQDVYTPTGDGLTWEEDYTGPVYTRPNENDQQELTLTYYPDRSMNPLQSMDFTNRALFSLIYQSLFVVDRDYNVFPVLCKSYEVSEDMKTYTFYPEKATFSDGSELTVFDVLASLQAAKESEVYGGRFLHVTEIALSPEGGVTILTDTPCSDLPILLDIPIVKQDQLEEAYPLGTGPYVMQSGEAAQLRRRTDWWCKAELAVTAPAITLIEAQSNTHIRDQFEFADLDLVCADPGSDKYTDYRCDFELWDCENGIFLYLSCNLTGTVFSDENVRAALTYAIDRDTIVDDNYRGFARSATLPASPLSPYYSSVLAEKYAYDPEKFDQAVFDAGMVGAPLIFVVNSDDTLRTRIAREISKTLTQAGFEVDLREKSGEAYRYAISTRDYDLYLGQTKLSANMDLSPFFSSSGSLSYGGINDVSLYALCMEALANEGNYYTLHRTVMGDGRICPILFRSYAVYATRGLLTQLTPSRDNVFFYTLGRTMENAKISQ